MLATAMRTSTPTETVTGTMTFIVADAPLPAAFAAPCAEILGACD